MIENKSSTQVKINADQQKVGRLKLLLMKNGISIKLLLTKNRKFFGEQKLRKEKRKKKSNLGKVVFSYFFPSTFTPSSNEATSQQPLILIFYISCLKFKGNVFQGRKAA